MDLELEHLLKQRSCSVDEKLTNWRLSTSDECGGRGAFACKRFEPGEIIFKDLPIVTGPPALSNPEFCVNCFKREPKLCSGGCHLPVCVHCEHKHRHDCQLVKSLNLKPHPRTREILFKSWALILCLYVSSEEKRIIECLQANDISSELIEVNQLKELLSLSNDQWVWLEHCCRVLHSVAFSMSLGDEKCCIRGMYPLTALLNHSCCPNTRRHFSPSGVMTVVATNPIGVNEELTVSYCQLLWATFARRSFLHSSKQFWCKCKRCMDPSEFGSYLAALKCHCGGNIIPKNPLEENSIWSCEKCRKSFAGKQIMLLYPRLVSQQSTQPFTFPITLHPNNQFLIQRKIQQVLDLQHVDNFEDWSMEKLKKIEFDVRHILKIINMLHLGDCRTKGFILHELSKLLKEKIQRGCEVGVNKEMNEAAEQAYSILKDDSKAANLLQSHRNRI